MLTRIFKPIVLLLCLLCLLCLLSSCNNDRRVSKRLLCEAAQTLEQKPGVALGLLHRTDINLLNDKEYAYYVLLRIRALGKTGVSIASFEEAATAAKDVLTAANDAPKVAYAYFVLAKVAEAQGKPSVELHYNLQADRWAEKASYVVPYFSYSLIPYNTAVNYFDEEQFDEALPYLDKALAHVEDGYSYKSHMLELKGLCFKSLGAIDSAFYYYAKAMELAEAACDTVSVNRIQYNRAMLLNVDDNSERAEERCRSLLASFPKSDSLSLGFMYMALSKIQLDSDKPDSAYANVYAAKNLLTNLENISPTDYYFATLALYKRLENAERAMKNTALADSYKQQRDSLIAAREENRKTELEELQVLIEQQDGENASTLLHVNGKHRGTYKQQQVQQYVLLSLLVLLIAAIILFLYWLRIARERAMRKLIMQEALVSVSSTGYLNQIAKTAVRVSVMDNDRVGLKKNAMKIADMADDLKHIVRELPALTNNHSKLYRRIRKDYPLLTETESYICLFLQTRTLSDKEIMSFLELTPDRYVSLKEAMYGKIAAANRRS